MNTDFTNFVKSYFEYANKKDIDIDSGIKIFLLHARNHKSINTYNYYVRTLSYIASYMKEKGKSLFSQITTKELDSYVDYERNIKENSNNTINKRIGALKTVSKYLASDNIKLLSNPISYEKLKIIHKDIKIVSKETLNYLLKYIETETLRNKVIILLLISTGIRRTECCHILKRNIDFNNSKIFLEHTKTNNPRYIFLNENLKKLIKELYNQTSSPYLLSNTNFPLSPSTIDSIFHRMKKGLTDKSISPHKLRHTFATTILRNNGGNIEQVRLLLGHSSYDMTKRYLHLLEDDLKASALKFNPLTIILK